MHNWQDIVLSIGSLLFSIALLPSVLGKQKPNLLSSIMTGIILIVFAITYASLSFWYATFTTALNAFVWFILAAQVKLKKD